MVYLEHDGGELEATIYRPQGEGPFPGLVDAHGGRWFLNDRSADHHMNAALAASGMVVAAVDFRLAPVYPYPAQIADVNYAVRWMKANAGRLNIAPDSVGAIGCSSGGHTVDQRRKLAEKLDLTGILLKRRAPCLYGGSPLIARHPVRKGPVATTEQTLASLSGSKYSFVIVELKEVVVKKRPRVVEWVPC